MIKSAKKKIDMFIMHMKGKQGKAPSRKNLSDSPYYIIRRNPPGAGFFSNYLYVASHICYALEKGYKPVVDMENYETLYSENRPINGTKNSWEYYYRQPKDVSLKEAYDSNDYILSGFDYHGEYMPFSETKGTFVLDKGQKLERLEEVISGYMMYNSTTEAVVNSKTAAIFDNLNGDEIIGVHVRGTDKRHENAGHYIAAQFDKYFGVIDEICKCNHVKKILICTDEEEAINAFKVKYREMVITTDSFKATQGNEEGLHFQNDVGIRENHKYKLGLEVITDMELLTKCTYLVFGHSNVTNVALIKNNQKFKRTFFIA